MARLWYWNVENDGEDFDSDQHSPTYGAWLRTRYYAVAGQPRLAGDPTDLHDVKCVEESDGAGVSVTWALGAVPYGSESDLVTAYNETVIERLQLAPEPNG